MRTYQEKKIGTVYLKDILCCPDCYGQISSDGDALACDSCNKRYPVNDGIYSILPSKLEYNSEESNPVFQEWLKLYPEVLDNYFYKKRLLNLIHEIPRKVLSLYSKKDLDKGVFLDLACGTGPQFPYYGRSLSNVIGIDINIHELKSARDKYPQALLIHGDCQRLPFKSNSFTDILSLYSLEHFFNLRQVLKEIGRVMKKGGKFLAAIPGEECALKDLIRRSTSHRYLQKKYGLDWSAILKMEHCNNTPDIVKALRENFGSIKIIYFPFLVPSAKLNLIMMIIARKS